MFVYVKMQVGLLWYIVANHGLSCAVALLQFLLSSLDQGDLLDGHHLSGRDLYHHLDVGQVLAARLSTSQSRLVDVSMTVYTFTKCCRKELSLLWLVLL